MIKQRELNYISYEPSERILMIHGQELSLRQNDEYCKTLFVYRRQHISLLIGFSRFDFLSLATKSKATCLDIGANIGYVSTYLALRNDVDRIFSFEPNDETFEILKMNASYYLKINPNQMLISQSSGVGFHLPNTINSAHSRTHSGQEGLSGSLNGNSVSMVSVDDFVEKNGLEIHVMKIDVEGHEIEVLEGARETVRSHAPLVLLELFGIRSYREGIVNQIKSVFFSEITSAYQILIANHDGFLFEIEIDQLLSLEVNDVFLVPNRAKYRF
jgi:FkbM family methyltransferase